VISLPAFLTHSQKVTTRKLWAVLLGAVAALNVSAVATAASLCPFAVTSTTQTGAAKFAIDALVLVRHALRLSNPTLQNGTGGTASLTTLENNIAANRLRWDVDGDNDFTVTDAIIIARYLAGFSSDAWIGGLSFATNAQRKTASALKQFIIDDGCPAPPSGFTGTVLTAPTGKISFRIDQAGKVSLAVYDGTGQMVRTLLNAVPFAAGTHTVDWNGKDDAGTTLAAGSYGFKLLQTPGLSAEYLMTLQTNLPIGSAWNSYTNWYGDYPLPEDGEVGIGNHVGPTAITADASGIYISSGSSETTSQMVKLAWDGSKRIWSAAQPDVSMGRYAMAVMGGRLYSLQQNGWLSYQGVNEPNFPSTDVGGPNSPNTLGARWNAQWPGSTRAGADDWATYSGAPMDMAASDAGGTAQLVLSYFDHNAVQWRNPTTGAVLDSVVITAPRGVVLDSQGRLLVATEGRVVRLSRADKTLVTVVSGLSSPYRITIDPTNDDILVAERGTDQRVKRFSSSGAAKANYGRLGGRQDGLYVAADFRNITDISPDGSGGFFVTEHAAPRRIAQFNSVGGLVREWYAGATWAPFAYPEPGNPSAVWAVSERFLGTASTSDVAEFMRLVLDLNTKTWRVHSTYRLGNLGNSLVPVNLFAFGAGLDALRPRRVNGALFLAQDAANGGNVAVLRVDESNWTIKPAAVLEFRGDTNGNFVWTDANGDGLAQESEIKRFSPGANEYSYYGYSAPTLRSDHALNYFSQGNYGQILRFPVASFNAIGNPVFAPLVTASKAAWAAHPTELVKPNGESNIYGANHALSFAMDGSVYGAFGIGDRGWSVADAGLVARWDANGKLLWKRSLRVSGSYYDNTHTYKPGEETWSTFRNNVGVVRDSVVAQDFNGGNTGYSGQAITYVWDRDGLYVGGLFDNIDTTKVGKRWYNLGSENGAGAVIEEPGSDHVIYFGSTESANHVYRIKGWSGWLRLSGQVQRP
jgi:FlgD Ig-like domain